LQCILEHSVHDDSYLNFDTIWRGDYTRSFIWYSMNVYFNRFFYKFIKLDLFQHWLA
jgi:hypothetical protein